MMCIDRTKTGRAVVVDYHGASRELLCRLIRACGREASAVDTLTGAENELESVECVVLDVFLPDGSGLELLRTIRERELPIRVAVTTTSAEEHLLEEIERLRPDAVFVKPIDVPRLIQWLEE